MPVPGAYGGRGADTVTYARALARIGREGTGVRTFFSGHTSIGEYPILTWGNEDQKRRYLPAAARGDKVLAFGLPEPEAANYARERQQHGKAIARHQLIQEHIAAIEMDRAATDALVLRAAEAKDASAAEPGNADLRARADLLAAQAKLFAANAAWDAADRAVQVFGGRGWSTLYRPGRHLQDVRVCRIYEGTDEILKLKIAAVVLGKEYEAFR